MTFETDAAGNIRHDEPNRGQIDEIWAILSVDGQGEGLMVVPSGGISFPLITGEKNLVPILKQMGEHALEVLGSAKTLRVVRFQRAGEELGE